MKKIFAFLVFVLIIGGAVLLLLKPSKYDFKAYSPSGEVSLQSFEGKYKAIYFGYLFCPDVCPTTLSLVGDVLTKLDRNDFELIFITLDPKRDKPEDLTMMAKNFYKDATGLKLLDIDKVTANYGVKFKEIPMPNSEMFYTVAHSSSIYLIDKNGKFYSEISNLTTENIKENILNLIKERP